MHIALDEIAKDPAALHNTSEEKQQRKAMLEGGRPDDCSYCWSIEDINKVSDRFIKNAIGTNNLFDLDEEIEILRNTPGHWSIRRILRSQIYRENFSLPLCTEC